MTFECEADYDKITEGDELSMPAIFDEVMGDGTVHVKNETTGETYTVRCELSGRMKDIIRCGGLLEYTKENLK